MLFANFEDMQYFQDKGNIAVHYDMTQAHV